MESAQTRTAGGIVIGPAGAIVLARKDTYIQWSLPKGHVEGSETEEETARREILEETGLDDLELLGDLGEYSRYSTNPDGSEDHSEYKHIHIFLFSASAHAELAPTDTTQEAKWVPFSRLAAELGNDAERAWFIGVFERVRQAIQRD